VKEPLQVLRWVVLGAASGGLAGLASYAFLRSLEWATHLRLDHGWLLYLLPLAGLAIGLVYHRWAGRASGGNHLLLEEIHTPTTWVPRRMAPMVFVGSVASHVFGASVGREGAAVQMSGSLSDLLARTIKLSPADRRILLVAAIGGGFGSIFGVPLAGAVFAMEVQAMDRVRYEAFVPALTASVVGDLVVGGLGFHHTGRAVLDVHVTALLLGQVAVAGVAMGLVSRLFLVATRTVRSLVARIAWPPWRSVAGGVATVAIALVVGRDELGLSTPLLDAAIAGDRPAAAAWILKLVLTAIALGCAFPGGEVTPIFVMGATLGGALAGPLGVDVSLLSGAGLVAMFAGASNTPLACTIMGAELFGSGSVVVMATACLAAYIASEHGGLYAKH
jgi:H+/Cl- antiporter ClcA